MIEKRDAVLVVAEEHQRRAAEFCRRHRDFTTTEAMDDIAEEFERVARVARARERNDAGAILNHEEIELLNRREIR